VYEFDLCDYHRIAPVIAGAHRVFHIGAIPSVPKSIDRRSTAMKAISTAPSMFSPGGLRSGKAGRVHLLRVLRRLTATTEVLPKVETMAPAAQIHPTRCRSWLGEYYASVFAQCFGLERSRWRFFNVFGPRQVPDQPVHSGVLSIFLTVCWSAAARRSLATAKQSRDFTYVEDVVSLLLKAAEAPGVSGKVFNAGNGGRYTLNQTWELLQEIEGIRLPAHYASARSGDVRHSQADTHRRDSRARACAAL